MKPEELSPPEAEAARKFCSMVYVVAPDLAPAPDPDEPNRQGSALSDIGGKAWSLLVLAEPFVLARVTANADLIAGQVIARVPWLQDDADVRAKLADAIRQAVKLIPPLS